MQFLRKIIDFYIFSNIHVAFAGFCMTKITLLEFENPTNMTPLFVALSIVVSYNFIRFYEIKTNRLNWLKKWFLKNTKSLLVLSILATFGLGYISFFTNFNATSFVILFPFAFMTFFYVIPLFKVGNIEISFRNFPGIKIVSIAMSWAGITVLFPLYEAGFGITSTVYIELLQRFLILIVITIPFDIRDINVDSKSLKTLPQALGVSNLKLLGLGILLLFVILTFLKENHSNNEVFINVVISMLTGFFLWFSSSKKSRYYTGFWVEAIPIFWLILIVLFL